MMRSLRALLATAALTIGSTACRWPRAQLVVSIESDLDYGTDRRMQFVNVTVRSGSSSGEVRLHQSFAVAPDGSNGHVALPFSFGVYARNNDAERSVWIEALACGADACATSAPIATARLQRTFERDQTVAVTLRLSANCDGISCADPATTCDPDHGVCAPATVTNAPAPPVAALAAGGGATCALHTDHSVHCWGGLQSTVVDLEFPGLDDATSSSPRAISGVDGLASISIGVGHACGIRASDHAIVCWGANTHGQLANGNTDPTSAVVAVATATPAVEVAAGRGHTCARHDDGTVSCWGRLLDPDHPGRFHDVVVPTRVEGIDHALQIAAGETLDCARIDDGSVRCWGSNTLGQLGTGDARLRLDPVTVAGVTNAISVSIGSTHACARIAGSTIRCWGANDFGALGNGTTARSSVSAPVVDLANVSQVVAAGSHTCARTADGAVWCWGRNDRGQLGDGSTESRLRPVRIEAVHDAIEIAAGIEHTCVRERSGEVRCWGSDVAGQLGNGREMVRSTPGPVAIVGVQSLAGGSAGVCALTDANTACWGLSNGGSNLGVNGVDQRGPRTSHGAPVAIAGLPASIHQVSMAARSTCVLFADGTVACWGDNTHGQLGDGTLESRATPMRVVDLDRVTEIATGEDFVCALRDDGTVRCWGSAGFSVVGSPSPPVLQRCGSTSCVTRPVAIEGLAHVIHVAGSGNHACALLEDHTVRCWGENSIGQCGSSDLGPQPAPVRVQGLTDVVQLALMDTTSCALLMDGTVRCWGDESGAQLGYRPMSIPTAMYCNGTECSVTPVPLNLPRGVMARELAAGPSYGCIITTTDRAVCWGLDDADQLGRVQGDWTCGGLPCSQFANFVEVQTRDEMGNVIATTPLEGVRQLALGLSHACARLSDGSVSCWGDNSYGQFGSDPSLLHTTSPTPIPQAMGATDLVAHWVGTCMLDRDGRLSCAGNNANGQVGNGEFGNPRVAVQSHVSNVTEVALTGLSTCALDRDGTVSCWGFNGFGSLGSMPAGGERQPEPQRVPGLANVRHLSAGGQHTCALLADGHVWCWGANDAGQLGDGSPGPRVAPVLVEGLDDVEEVRAGGFHTCALRAADHSVWCWGANFLGQLGIGSTVPAPLVRVQGLPSGRTVTSLAAGLVHTCALLDDGTVYCWGDASNGQIGDRHTSSLPTAAPISPVYGLTDAVAIRAGYFSTCATRRTGATVCWGDNSFGILGNGMNEPAAPQPTPFITPGISDIAPGRTLACGIDDSTHEVRCWGDNHVDQLGNPSALEGSIAPVRVVGVPDAVRVETSFNRACAVRSNGDVMCWGDNVVGGLGVGTLSAVLQYDPVRGLGRMNGLSAGFALGCASLDDGTVRCWGSNPYGQLGYVGPEGSEAHPVGALEGVDRIASGASHSCALMRDHTVRCWGSNDSGQLGVDVAAFARVAALGVNGIANAAEVTAGGSHTCARGIDGSVACWGANDSGQLGRATSGRCAAVDLFITPTGASFACDSAPATIAGLASLRSVVAGGRHTCAIDSNGGVLCWGSNSRGQLGRTAGDPSATPIAVPDLGDVTQLALSRRVRCDFGSETAPQCVPTGDDHTCALRLNGEIWCWGANDRGQLGDGTREDRAMPLHVPIPAATSVIAGGNFTCATFMDRTVKCWGDASEGTMGDGAMVFATEPRVIASP